jgi:hypothetical protein
MYQPRSLRRPRSLGRGIRQSHAVSRLMQRYRDAYVNFLGKADQAQIRGVRE